MKLNLGCGGDYKEGYINCDISSELKVDKIIDLEKPLPFENNSVDEIIIEHCLEHIKNLYPLLEEFQRICKRGAMIKIKVPYFSSESAFSTMTHIRFFTYTSFDILDENNPRHYDSPKVNFKIINKKLNWRPIFKPLELLFNLFPRVYQELFCWWFPARELEIKLKKKQTTQQFKKQNLRSINKANSKGGKK